VEYLRAIYYPLENGGFRFPVITLDGLKAMGDEHVRRLAIEFGREIATLLMLGAVGVAAARNRREAWAHFMIAFGVWDIFYYVWLKAFIGWPENLMTWDLLFLVPVPWVSPVLAPVLISISMIAAGTIVLHCEAIGQPLRTRWVDWLMISSGGVIVIVAFCWDYRNIMDGGLPNPFPWLIFGLGLSLSAATFVCVMMRGREG
jgi:hypothetical protein